MSRENETGFEMNQELSNLAQALRENRPTPEPEFTERLDQAVADHFPPEWADEAALGKKGRGGIGSLTERFRRRMGGRRILLPAMASFAGLLIVATVVVGAIDSGRLGGGTDGTTIVDTEPAPEGGPELRLYSGASSADMATPESVQSEKSKLDLAGPASAGGADASGFARMQGNRDVAKEAEITLGTDPEGVQDVANKVVEVTDEHNGIVMDSKVTDGEAGAAGATFSLMIPSGQMDSAVADLSGIADLRSRSQELTDITAPTNRAEDRIADSEAKIQSLLRELEETYDEGERAELEQQIRWERQQKRWAETRLNRLERRADYTPVALKVETGGDTSSDDESSSWGLGDAVDDAGKMLGVAAGVTVIALAIAIPIGIVVLIALALNRAWVRRSRRRILADDQ